MAPATADDLERRRVPLAVRRILGTATPYHQGGSLRVILPREVVRAYGLEDRHRDEVAKVSLVFIETDLGVLVLPLVALLHSQALRDALGYARSDPLTP
jgi:hypothetical protein